jgi:general stress protein 26
MKESAMARERELEEKFWKALKSDRTVMLGLAGVDEGHSQPMTAQLNDDGDGGPLWFFTSKDTDLARALGRRHRAVAHFAAKGHDLFASLHGELVIDDDRATIDRLWNRFVAAWFEGGKDDPKLRLLRLDPERAQIWLNENNLFAGVKLLLGRDPKEEYKDKVAEVELPG